MAWTTRAGTDQGHQGKGSGQEAAPSVGKADAAHQGRDLVTRLKESLAAAHRKARPSRAARPAARKRATAARKKSAA